ncbi:MAG: recombinase family protein [Bdellovibrionales bacterium]
MITHIKRIPLLKLPSFLHQKYIVESLTINQIAELTLSSRSTVIKYLNAAGIPIRDEEHRRGGSVFGERKLNGRYVPNQNELILIEKMKTLRGQGLSFRQIAEFLQGLNLPTKRKGKWTCRSVHRILDRI